ncbi:DUF5709 domain-containing protein [Intrasporangium sp.]|jgi:hypothetical protein|uniref:DUF5709 domain-containing protein n=1 Tax=Intrasporangium sp. TaxID=1925024 RepID=UPI0033654BC0
MSGTEPNENISDDLTTYSVDDEDQLQPEDTLVSDGVEDALDRGYSPPDTARGSNAFGTTAYEQSLEETIDQRILQEEPDPNSAYGAPHNESGLDEDDRVGGDDPDSIDAEDDWLGDSEVGDRRAGRLVSDDEGTHEDTEKELWARDVGIDGAAASAEEAAVHIIDGTSNETTRE